MAGRLEVVIRRVGGLEDHARGHNKLLRVIRRVGGLEANGAPHAP